GNYDIAYLRCIPNMVVAAPSDENEARLLLTTCYRHEGPAAVRYPRGAGRGAAVEAGFDTVPLGKGRILRQGRRIAIVGFGTLVPAALDAGERLDATVADMRFVKPLDTTLLDALARDHDAIVTVEEAALMGSADSAVLEHYSRQAVQIPVLQLGLPDRFIDHGEQGALLRSLGLDADGIERSILARFPAPALQEKDKVASSLGE